MFGWNSLFSGQPLYEKYIYQMYNITMTSLPIMWFAIYDFEFEKDRPAHKKDDSSRDSSYLLRNPLLYKIGMENECFTMELLGKWIGYAIYHSTLIYVTVLYLLTKYDAYQPDGKDLGFWLAGHAVYGACIFVVNVLLLVRFHTHTLPGLFLSFLMFAAFFVFLCVEAQYPAFVEIYGLADTLLGSLLVWAGLILCVWVAAAPEILLKARKLYMHEAKDYSLNSSKTQIQAQEELEGGAV